MTNLSIREFAKREGCDEKMVRRAIKTGHLKKDGQGVSSDFVGTSWRRRKNGSAPVVTAKDGETPEQAAERLTLKLFEEFPTKADAERVKETYLALMRKVEFDRMRGTVCLVSDVAHEVSAEYSRMRSRLIPIGAQLAPKLAMLKSASEIQALIDKQIGEALEELAYDERLRASR